MIHLHTKRVRYITIFASIVCLFWLFCLGWAVQDYYSAASPIEIKQKEPEKAVDTGKFSLVALGDSLTRGTGDESGKGYVGLVTDDLKERFGKKISVHNLGVSGAVSSELKNQMKQKEIKRQLGEADAIMLTIGGNDLFQGGQTLIDIETAGIEDIQEKYLQNLKDVFTTIRSVNNQATVYMIGLYNPFIELEDNETTSRIVREWNFQTEDLASSFSDIVFVPTYDIFQLSVNDYLYTDKFHPNKEGYNLIAKRISPLIKWEEEKK